MTEDEMVGWNHCLNGPEGALRLADLTVDGIDVSGEIVRPQRQRDDKIAQHFCHGDHLFKKARKKRLSPVSLFARVDCL